MASPPRQRQRAGRDGSNTGTGEQGWNRFLQRRHRLKPPELFDEVEKRFEKYEQVAAGADVRPRAALSPTLKTLLTEVERVDDEPPSVDMGLGLRKARFFDSCLRADRSVEFPRRVRALSPVTARESKLAAVAAKVQEVRLPGSPRLPEPVPTRITTNNDPQDWVQKSITLLDGLTEVQAPLKQLDRHDRAMQDLVNQCRRVRLHPATTGIVRAQGEEKLQLEYGFLTDERAEAMNGTLKASSADIREARFRANGLSDFGAGQLLEALPSELESVDLSQNDLDHGTGWCRSFRRLNKLRSLTLSDCQITDNTCLELLNDLVRCRSLTRIDISCNAISVGAAFQPLLKRFNYLEELDLHWNHFTGEGAVALIQGIMDNEKSGGRLRYVNLSWNPLGKSGAEETCQMLVKYFRETTVLRHLDISRCDLSLACCRHLAEGLKENRSIVGFHVSGNEATVDAQGFLIPRQPLQHSSRPDDEELQGVSKASLAMEEEDCNCWVCNRWRETRLSYMPGISGPDVSDVWVFTSIDGFTTPLKLQRIGEEFVTYVMAAPGPLCCVFQAGTSLLCSRTAPEVELREMVAAMKGGLGVYSSTSISPVLGKDGPALRLRRARLPGEEDDETTSPAADSAPLDVDVDTFSTIMVVARPADEPVCTAYIPRLPGELTSSTGPRQAWNIESSLFAPHFEPLTSKQFCERCLDADWHLSKIWRLVPDEVERAGIRDLLRSKYAEMKVLYSSLCSVDWSVLHGKEPRRLAFGIGPFEFTHMLVQHNLIGQDLSLKEADALFIASALPPKDTKKMLEEFCTEGRIVQRHGFFELLVRLAIGFARGNESRGTSKGQTDQVRRALYYLMTKHLLYPYAPMKNNFRCLQWRETVLHSEQVEGIYCKHMKAVIDPLFSAFASPKKRLSTEDWFRMLDCMEVMPCTPSAENAQMNAWDRAWAWQSASITQMDELTSTRSLEMSFVEFLEALARVVGLLRSRQRVVEGQSQDENEEPWDYGLGVASPPSIFCLDQGIMDPHTFAAHLETFLCGPKVKQALPK